MGRAVASVSLVALGLTALGALPASANTGVAAGEPRLTGQLALGDGSGLYTPVTASGGSLGLDEASAFASAAAAASTVSIPAVGERGVVRFAKDLCLTHRTTLASCDETSPMQLVETVRHGDDLTLQLPGFEDVVFGADFTRGLAFDSLTTAGHSARLVLAEFRDGDQLVTPPAEGVRLEGVFAYDTGAGVIVGGRAAAGAVVTVTLDGQAVGTTESTPFRETGLFALLVPAEHVGATVSVAAVDRDGDSASTDLELAPGVEGPVTATGRAADDGSVTVSGTGTPGAQVAVSSLTDPSDWTGDDAVDADGHWSVDVRPSGAVTTTAADPVLLQVTQTAAGGEAHTTYASVGLGTADEVRRTIPAVFSYLDDAGSTFYAGFREEADGTLTATAEGVRSHDEALAGATALSWTLRADGTVTNAAGDSCLEGPGDGPGDTRVALRACDGGGLQQWTWDDDGHLSNSVTARNLQYRPGVGGAPGALHNHPAQGSSHSVWISAPELLTPRFTVGATVDRDTATFTGTAPAGATVDVSGRLNGDFVDTVFTGDDTTAGGTWSNQVPTATFARIHDETLRFTVTLDHIRQTIEVPFDIDDLVALGGLSDGSTVGTAPTLRGTARPGDTIVARSGDTVLGQTVLEPASGRAADDDVDFALPVSGLTAGEHLITLSQTQPDSSLTSVERVRVIVDPARDVSPTAPTARVTYETADRGERGTVAGTSMPNAFVSVSGVSGTVLGTAWADGDGAYRIPFEAPGRGVWTLKVAQEAGGPVSDTRSTYAFFALPSK